MAALETPSAPDSGNLERFRLNPPAMAEALGGDYTPEQIVEMIQDVDKRQQLASQLLETVPQVNEQYADIEALNRRLEIMAEVLPQKKSFFEGVREKANWAFDKIRGALSHPVLTTVLVGLVAWWAWGHMHGILAEAHGVAAAEGAGTALQGADGAAGLAHPAMGPGMETTGGGMSAPGLSGDMQFEPPSEVPPEAPPEPTTT